jgi:hypothetical protein
MKVDSASAYAKLFVFMIFAPQDCKLWLSHEHYRVPVRLQLQKQVCPQLFSAQDGLNILGP